LLKFKLIAPVHALYNLGGAEFSPDYFRGTSHQKTALQQQQQHNKHWLPARSPQRAANGQWPMLSIEWPLVSRHQPVVRAFQVTPLRSVQLPKLLFPLSAAAATKISTADYRGLCELIPVPRFASGIARRTRSRVCISKWSLGGASSSCGGCEGTPSTSRGSKASGEKKM